MLEHRRFLYFSVVFSGMYFADVSYAAIPSAINLGMPNKNVFGHLLVGGMPLRDTQSLLVSAEGIYYTPKKGMSYASNELYHGNPSSVSGLLNLQYRFTSYETLIPFMGLGAGLSYNKQDKAMVIDDSKARLTPAYSIFFGASKSLTRKCEVEGLVKLMSLGACSSDANKSRLSDTQVSVGLKYKF